MPIKVLVVDDTILYRSVISTILKQIPDIEVVGSANNGKIALSYIEKLKPDLLTLDIEMPEMNGLEVLAEIKRRQLNVDCIMVSAFTQTGSEATIQALEAGAFDFITKPSQGTSGDSREELTRQLQQVIANYRHRYRRLLEQQSPSSKPRTTAAGTPATTPSSFKAAASPFVAPRLAAAALRPQRAQIITIGISTGGPNALGVLLPRLPADLGVPVLIVQHMPPVFTRTLAESLNRKCELRVKEAEAGEALERNTVYIAPGGKQMGVNRQRLITVTDDPPENNCRPSVDYLFRCVATEYGGAVVAVVMTGMGSDGKLGMQQLLAKGARTIAQDRDSSTVYGMPKAVIEAGLAQVVVSLDQLADVLTKSV
ncbi:MAG: chemotaxis response regulator protein-glutamate methylesterase [Gammaproteobacteria bacterium]|nr:chemotaxis response regulator protein-glutamate methylesterase [Gammaproteobacteria bacterium]